MAVFVKIPGAPGGSNVKDLAEFYLVSSMSWGVKSPRDVATGQASGKRQHGTFRLTRPIDTASKVIHDAYTKSQALKGALLVRIITPNTANGQNETLMDIELGNPKIARYQMSGFNGGPDLPVEDIEVTYTTIKFTHVPSKAVFEDSLTAK